MQYSQWDTPPMMNTPPHPPASQWGTPPTNFQVQQSDQNRPNNNPGPCKAQTLETIQSDLNFWFFASIIPIIVFIGNN